MSSPEPKSHPRHWLALIRADGIGPGTALRLLERFGDPATLLDAAPADWRAAGLPEALHAGLARPDWAGVDRDLDWLEAPGRALVTIQDAKFPARLRAVPHAPLALFCQGAASLLDRPQLAIVGARSATAGGRELAHGFASELTRRGLLVSSGLALGIDGAAHRGALEAGGATLAVCGTGLDRVYPARHRELAHAIAERGLLVSEFPTGTPPLPDHFPRRNRILSGLAHGVLVVEAAVQSGSLVTARLAMEQGREVFAIPGSIHSPTSRGVHQLIRQGAKLTETVDDILDELAPQLVGRSIERAAPPPTLEPEQRRVLEALGHDPLQFDRLVERLALPVDRLSATLLALELRGHIASLPGGTYQRLS